MRRSAAKKSLAQGRLRAEIHSALLALERRLLAASEVSFELESDSACWIRSDAVVGFSEFPNSLAAEEPKG